MFSRLSDAGDATVEVNVEGVLLRMRPGESAAAAVILAGLSPSRLSPVAGEPRAPYCMMGVCFECLMVIDGVASRQACLVPVRQGMRIRRQTQAGPTA